ncbi:hypothetical protein MMC16_001961 [Acarospora aff. strigata]|nr:hypothetical protein [Acarospora aff. strigata]
MAAIPKDLPRDAGNEPGSRISSVPLLGEGFSETTQTTSKSIGTDGGTEDGAHSGSEKPETSNKSGRRRFWGLGKRKEDDKSKKKSGGYVTSEELAGVGPITAVRPTSPLPSPNTMKVASSPQRVNHPYGTPSSPGRHLYSSSPRIASPASSQIFERDVQEDGLVAQASPAIPGHITTENHIPPVLEASSLAITDNHLDPDHVEIVMHSAHQPAAMTVTGSATNEVAGSHGHEDPLAHVDNDDTASSYGALDSNDVRRLSFISFADVVHSEHAEHGTGRDSVHLADISSNAPPPSTSNRSPSPMRSPVSSHSLGGSPPTSASASLQGPESSSPNRGGRGPTSPLSAHSPPATGSELTIETMRQALRKTGSGDLGGARSQPMSAVGGDEGHHEQSFR